MSSTGNCGSGFKSPANGSVNVPTNSSICVFFDGVDEPDFDEINLWVGGLQVVRDGNTARGWEFIERGCESGRMYLRVRYRGNLPSSHIFCYAKYKNRWAKCHFFVVGANSGGQVILKENSFERSVGTSSMDQIIREHNKCGKNYVSCVKGDIFYGEKYVMTIPDGVKMRDLLGNKCHFESGKCFIECKDGIMILWDGRHRKINMNYDFLIKRNENRLDIIEKGSARSFHIYMNKDLEMIDLDGDIFHCNMEGHEKFLSGNIKQQISSDTKICFDSQNLISKKMFEPISGSGESMLWTAKDMEISRIDDAQIADLGNIYVRCGQEKRLVNMWTPEVVKV